MGGQILGQTLEIVATVVGGVDLIEHPQRVAIQKRTGQICHHPAIKRPERRGCLRLVDGAGAGRKELIQHREGVAHGACRLPGHQ